VKFIAYTSLLHADKSPLGLHVEHVETEKMLADSGILMPCCATAGIPKTIWPARRRRWSMACLSVPPARAKSPPPPAQTMPPPPPALSPEGHAGKVV
jgi:hypothetical protein